MAEFCDSCPGVLYEVDLIVGATTCVECIRKPLDKLLAAATRAKHAGQQQALDARPEDRARVESAIRQLAANGKPFSANDARSIHGVKGGVVGATFTALAKSGLIRAVGDETSTDRGTHGKSVALWIGVAVEAAA